MPRKELVQDQAVVIWVADRQLRINLVAKLIIDLLDSVPDGSGVNGVYIGFKDLPGYLATLLTEKRES